MTRYLFVHAHPDDETLATGVALAHLRAAGHDVHVLTCTLGEEGEVIPADLAHLEAHPDDALGLHRLGELRAAMAVLGIDHEVLGAEPERGILSRYRDSGMAGTASAAHPRAFVNAPPDEAARLVEEVIDRVDPDVVVTYDEHGGYAHPDHIQTHRVTCAAVAARAAARRRVPALYAVLTPRSWAVEDRAWLADHPAADPVTLGWSIPASDDPYPPSVVPDLVVTHAVVDEAARTVQAAALREHVTQVTVDAEGLRYALSNHIAARLSGREGYAVLDPATGHPVPPRGRQAADEGAPRHTGLRGGGTR